MGGEHDECSLGKSRSWCWRWAGNLHKEIQEAFQRDWGNGLVVKYLPYKLEGLNLNPGHSCNPSIVEEGTGGCWGSLTSQCYTTG